MWNNEKWNIILLSLIGQVYITPKTIAACNYTYKESTKFHYHFMHPSSGKLFSLLKKGISGTRYSRKKTTFEKMTEECETGNQNPFQTFRFRADIPEENTRFIENLQCI